jgi:O-antigen/teichoic acid export membrane protein
VYVRRALGPELAGQADVIRLFTEVAVGVASLGMGHVVLRFLPGIRLGLRSMAPGPFLARGLGLQAAGWALVLALVVASRASLEAYGGTASITGLIVLAMGLLVTRLAFDTACQVYYAALDRRLISAVTVIWQIVFFASVIVGIERGLGVLAVVIGGPIANTVGLAILAANVRGRLAAAENAPSEKPASPINSARMLRYGLPFAAVHAFKNIVWSQSETLFIRNYWSDAAAGWFGTAYQFSRMILELVPVAIWPLVMASFAAIFELDRRRARSLTATYYKLLFLSAVPLSVGGVVLGDRALEVVFGPEFAPAGPLTQAFFGLLVVTFLGTPLSMMFYLLERPWINLLVWMGAAVLNVGLDLLLIPRSWSLGGFVPVAVAVSAMPVAYAIILKRLGITIEVPWAFIGRCYLGALPLLLLIPLRGWVADPLRLVAAAGLAAGLVTIGMRAVRLFRDGDRALIAFLPTPHLKRFAFWIGGGTA